MHSYVFKLLSKYAEQMLLAYHGEFNTQLFGFCDTIAPNQRKPLKLLQLLSQIKETKYTQ